MTPRNQEKVFDPKYADELLRIAEGDLATARFLLGGFDAGIRPENLFYLAQQSIEKALKAVLCGLGRPVPLVHELGALVAKMPEDVQPVFGYELGRLNEFASTRRYEEGRFSLTREEAEDVLLVADTLLAWAKSVVASRRPAAPAP